MARLIDVAGDMKAQAMRAGRSFRTLPGGLEVTLALCGGQRVLSLMRMDERPKDEEVRRFRMVFGVPDVVEAEVGDLSVTMRWDG